MKIVVCKFHAGRFHAKDSVETNRRQTVVRAVILPAFNHCGSWQLEREEDPCKFEDPAGQQSPLRHGGRDERRVGTRGSEQKAVRTGGS